jgi:DNA polymerase (family 10)
MARLRSSAPAGTLPGLTGPLLLRVAGQSVGDVARALKQGRMGWLPAIARAFALHRPCARIPRHVGSAVLAAVQAQTGRSRTVLVGSWRRGKAVTRDVDVLSTAALPRIDFAGIGAVLAVYADGPKKRSAVLRVLSRGQRFVIPVDLFRAAPAEWGSALLHFTGPARYNIGLRVHARAMGYTLSQHGAVPLAGRGSGPVLFATERGAIKFLGKKWKDPSDR